MKIYNPVIRGVVAVGAGIATTLVTKPLFEDLNTSYGNADWDDEDANEITAVGSESSGDISSEQAILTSIFLKKFTKPNGDLLYKTCDEISKISCDNVSDQKMISEIITELTPHLAVGGSIVTLNELGKEVVLSWSMGEGVNSPKALWESRSCDLMKIVYNLAVIEARVCAAHYDDAKCKAILDEQIVKVALGFLVSYNDRGFKTSEIESLLRSLFGHYNYYHRVFTDTLYKKRGAIRGTGGAAAAATNSDPVTMITGGDHDRIDEAVNELWEFIERTPMNMNSNTGETFTDFITSGGSSKWVTENNLRNYLGNQDVTNYLSAMVSHHASGISVLSGDIEKVVDGYKEKLVDTVFPKVPTFNPPGVAPSNAFPGFNPPPVAPVAPAAPIANPAAPVDDLEKTIEAIVGRHLLKTNNNNKYCLDRDKASVYLTSSGIKDVIDSLVAKIGEPNDPKGGLETKDVQSVHSRIINPLNGILKSRNDQ